MLTKMKAHTRRGHKEISGMSDLQSHTREVGKTLAPEYGPETPSDAVDRLLECYQKLDEAERYGFVAALIGELVTLKTAGRYRRPAAREEG